MFKFEWHDKKAEANRQKHKVLFEDAEFAIANPLGELQFNSFVDNEDRWQIIGMSRTGLPIFVVFTFRENDKYRIISARRLSKRERRKL